MYNKSENKLADTKAFEEKIQQTCLENALKLEKLSLDVLPDCIQQSTFYKQINSSKEKKANSEDEDSFLAQKKASKKKINEEEHEDKGNIVQEEKQLIETHKVTCKDGSSFYVITQDGSPAGIRSDHWTEESVKAAAKIAAQGSNDWVMLPQGAPGAFPAHLRGLAASEFKQHGGSLFDPDPPTAEQVESSKQQYGKKQEEQDRENKEITMAAEIAKQKEAMQQSNPEPERRVKLDEKKAPKQSDDSNQIYNDWLKKYKKEQPDFKENENKFENGLLKFQDPHAEEDFVRDLAKNGKGSGVYDKGILIAKFEDGKLIDPRTNNEFQKGEYANLVQQLDAGKAYKDIPVPKGKSLEHSSDPIDMKPPLDTKTSVNNLNVALNKLPSLEPKSGGTKKAPEETVEPIN